MHTNTLNGAWELHDEPLNETISPDLVAQAPDWIAQPVPGDIHQGLMAAGRISDPLVGLNSFDCRWTEERAWWFRRRFPSEPGWLDSDAVELELNGLDANASIYLNGAHLGDQRSAFHPFTADIKRHLRSDGSNTLLVRLTSGVEDVSEAQLAALGVPVGTEAGNGRPERGDPRRVYVRKPQYSFGWDWSPRVATTAIGGDAVIRAWNTARIRDAVSVRPERAGRKVILHIAATVEVWHYYRSAAGTVTATVTDEQGRTVKATRSLLLRSGLNTVEFALALDDPQYWWPNGLGAQHLYTVEASLDCRDSAPDGLRERSERSVCPPLKYGLRFIELDSGDPLNGVNRFAVVVNGKRIFSKGADWIPADTLYARVPAEKYVHLVEEARAANFNMLRVWGGGLYEPEAFYAACDRAGILLWHDFMFACAPYPDHEDWFREEVRREADYQTRRLRNHACMALWSGSNENNWGFDEWWHDQTDKGAYLYNVLLPATVQANCPNVPYWNGSPYGGAHPNSAEAGDRHHWSDCMMNPLMEKRITPEEYDKCQSLFVSEYGYIGAPEASSVREYLGDAPFDRRSPVWQHHNNTFEKDTVEAGIRKHYADPETLTLDDYFLYSGLTQGLMYGYSLDSLRQHANCHGGLFWMYADCWGEVGWTIMDYYLRRKISWYFVRRALSPARLILREADGVISVTMANDAPEALSGVLEYGSMALDGGASDLKSRTFRCPPLARKEIARFRRSADDPALTLWMARVADEPAIWPALLRAVDMRRMRMSEPRLTLKAARGRKGMWRVRIGSDVFAHAVHLALPPGAQPEDDYFDLLPGETREVQVAFEGTLHAQDVTVTSVVCRG
ncbi:MAG: beta-mannosidase [Chloroflexi bacterium]|nr:beta-mannosidase [Chloroflexota bacterium]MCL5274406.1 beta-mannosidase [Chloroflexota bacterium]